MSDKTNSRNIKRLIGTVLAVAVVLMMICALGAPSPAFAEPSPAATATAAAEPAIWETAYLNLLDLKKNDILGYTGSNSSIVALKDINADGVPELFFIAANGKPHNEADLMIFTYHGEQAVELFSSTAFWEVQMMPDVHPFMAGSDFWIYLFDPTETGITAEYRRYTLSDGVLTLEQTVPVEYRLYTELDEMPDFERLPSAEALELDRSYDKQAEYLFENDAMCTGTYYDVYAFIAERQSSTAPTATSTPARIPAESVNAVPTTSTVYVDGEYDVVILRTV